MFVWVKMLKGHPLRLYLTSSLLFIVSVSFSSYEGTAASSRIRSWFKTVILSQLHWLQGTSCAIERPLCFLLCDVLKCAFAIWKVLSLFLPETPNSQNHISVFESWMKRYMWDKPWCCKHWTDFMASRCTTELGGDNNASMTTGEVRKIFLLLQSQDLKRTFKKMASHESRNVPSCLLSK